MVQIIAHCPRCGNSRLLDDGAADTRVRCRRCNKLFKVPALGEIPKALAVLRQAKSTVHVDEDGRTYG